MSISFPATRTGHDAGEGICWVIGLEPLDASESPQRPLADLLAQMARQLVTTSPGSTSETRTWIVEACHRRSFFRSRSAFRKGL
jgi:hypothetical protein